jgi:hypothetical protein
MMATPTFRGFVMATPVTPLPDPQTRIRELEAELTYTRLQLVVAHRDRDEFRRRLDGETDHTAGPDDSSSRAAVAHPWLDIQIAELERK